ncbi:MAG: type I restriction enzyme HsdR N-terminal domain-containing protein [Candidatus Brocadiales bacterium]
MVTRRKLAEEWNGFFERVMGYDVLKHLSRERAVRGAGETEHVDFNVQLEPGEDAKSIIMVELKRVGVDLALKHLKQVTSYAIDAGCEWTLLTNGREWRLYHVEFGQPPETSLLEQWDLMKDDPVVLAARFETINYKNVKKGSLDKLWRKTKVLAKENLLTAVFSPETIRLICRMLRKSTGVRVAPGDVFSGMGKLLNESAAIELSTLKIDPSKKRRIKQKDEKKEQGKIAKSEVSVEKPEQEIAQASNNLI